MIKKAVIFFVVLVMALFSSCQTGPYRVKNETSFVHRIAEVDKVEYENGQTIIHIYFTSSNIDFVDPSRYVFAVKDKNGRYIYAEQGRYTNPRVNHTGNLKYDFWRSGNYIFLYGEPDFPITLEIKHSLAGENLQVVMINKI